MITSVRDMKKVDFSSIDIEGAVAHAHRTTEGWVSMLQELINNVIGSGATKIQVLCQRDDTGRPRVIVRDNGSGIADLKNAVQYYNGGVNQHSLEGIGLKSTKRFSNNRYIITKTADDAEARVFDWDNDALGIYSNPMGDWSTMIVLDDCVGEVSRKELEELFHRLRHYFDFLETKRGEIFIKSEQIDPPIRANVQLSNLKIGEEYFSTGEVPFGGTLVVDGAEINTALYGLSTYQSLSVAPKSVRNLIVVIQFRLTVCRLLIHIRT